MSDKTTDDQLYQLLLAELRLIRADISSIRSELFTEVTELKMSVTHLNTILEHNGVATLSNRINSVESGLSTVNQKISHTDDDHLDERVSQLEKGEARRQGVAAGLGLLAGGLSTAVIRFLLQ